MFLLPENEEYVEETDNGKEPLRGPDSKPTHTGKRSTSQMYETHDEEEENAHIRHLRRVVLATVPTR